MYVSRGGEKLEAALNAFEVDVREKVAADLGSSTGGFVDCLLQKGAKKVYSVDTSYGELAWKLRNDPRVLVMERTNAMHVVLPEKMDIVTVDVGWTRQEKIIPNALANLKEGGVIITLIKPHYEAGKARLGEGEVEGVLEKVEGNIESFGGRVEGIVESPIVGKRGGNREWLVIVKRS
jgi:23S rRNA (cytidine1920-2'-O)/16S rRNA (cytidine1409-2'-O)-methyltransferase